MALKENGNKQKVTFILEKPQVEFLEREASRIGLTVSAYLRMLVAEKMIEKGER